PFGMQMPGRHMSSKDYRFGFNGKEKDDEISGQTGSHMDFGARLYDSRIARWTAVDPLAGKYPSLSPYNFVANSPITFVDPDGRVIRIYYEGGHFDFDGTNFSKAPDALFVQQVLEAYTYNVGHGGGEKMLEAAFSTDVFDLKQEEKNSFKYTHVGWNPYGGLLSYDKENDTWNMLSPASALEHEIDHQLEDWNKNGDVDKSPDEDYGNVEEKRVIEGSERRNAIATGEIKKGHNTRTSHSNGYRLLTTGPISTTVSTKRTLEYLKKMSEDYDMSKYKIIFPDNFDEEGNFKDDL
ncbi:MAG: RHS repeat-associated core domain-containing protein, partial [Proteobacteria bacterium]|nr:RHS repeat-associated core domain-containing protein [Pseudomonadota bacterium]